MASSHIPQIFLRITIQNQICIAQWIIVDEIIQLRSLCHGHVQRVLYPGAVDGEFSPIPEQQENTLSYQLSSLTAEKPTTFTRDQFLFLLQQFRVAPFERTKAYCRRPVDSFVDHIELILYFNISGETVDKNKKAPRSNPSKESSTEKRLVRHQPDYFCFQDIATRKKG